MKFEHVNISEMEKQRYAAIKRTNKYLEMNLIIGVDDDRILEKGLTSKHPVVITTMNKCSSQEIGCFYMTLQEIIKSLEKQYPIECYAAKMTMEVQDIGSVQLTKENKKK